MVANRGWTIGHSRCAEQKKANSPSGCKKGRNL